MQETNCAFQFQGKTFTAGGAWVSIGSDASKDSAGVYVRGDIHREATGKVTSWNGEELGVWRVVSRWQEYRGGSPYRMASLRVVLGPNSPAPGSKWHGRMGYEWTQLLRLRRVQSRED